MNIFLLTMNVFILATSLALISILIRYLKQVPLDKQFVRHRILIDLAHLTMSFVFLISASVIVRHILGPFGEVRIVETIMLFVQSLYDLILACIVSLQVNQVLHVFYSAKVNDLKEDVQVVVHRVFVLVMGLTTALYICHVKGGSF